MWRTLIFLVAYATATAGIDSAIPPAILFKMRSVKTAEDFVRLFHRPPVPSSGELPDKGEGIPPVRPEVPNGEEGTHERDDSFSIMAQSAKCLPRPTPVKIPSDADPSVFIWPPCVELHRCGGCCNTELFACEVSATQNVDVVVYLSRYDPGEKKLQLEQTHTFTLTNETDCSCGCKVKPHHCNLAVHRHENCQCVCIQEKRDCPSRMVWDERTCGCVCRNRQQAITGRICKNKNKVWLESTCKCDCPSRESCPPGLTWHPAKCKCDNRFNNIRLRRCRFSCPIGQDLDLETCVCKTSVNQKTSVSRLMPLRELHREVSKF